MIRMTNGFTCINGVFFDPRSGEFEAGAEVEQYLVSRGVAEYAQDAPAEGVATAQGGVTAPAAGENPPAGEDAQDGVTGHLDARQLATMTNAQLQALAGDMGLDASKCRKKADYIELITAEEVNVPPDGEGEDPVDDGDLPPELSAEEPVV